MCYEEDGGTVKVTYKKVNDLFDFVRLKIKTSFL
jgi:hypothetical protein